MEELNHHDHNLTCYQTDDVRNWSDAKIADQLFTPPLTTLLAKTFIPMVFIIGFFGNVAFLLLLARVKTMRTITNFYLANLAAADLMILSLETFTRLRYYLISNQVTTERFHTRTNFGCVMFYFTIHLPAIASILLITLVSFDRYFAICHPLKYRNKKNKKQASCVLTLLAWIISAVLSLFRALASGRLIYICIIWPSHEKYKYFPDTVTRCNPIHHFFREDILENLVHSAPFIAALITNTIINIRIIQRLRSPPPGENGNQQHQQIKRRITWMLVANFVIFFSCLTPEHVFLIFWRLFSYSKQRYYTHTSTILVMLNSAINPILYGLASPSYRRAFLKAFGIVRNQIEPMDDRETERTPAN